MSSGPVLEFGSPAIKLMESGMVYPVREDSFLMMRCVMPFIEDGKGTIMDMGCGAGLISCLAGSRGWRVVSADRNPFALSLTRVNMELNGLIGDRFLTDLFEGIPLSFLSYFDLVSFNPPYLPDSGIGLDPLQRLALEGGEKGHEKGMGFLEKAFRYIKDDGAIMMLWSKDELHLLEELCSGNATRSAIVRSGPGTVDGMVGVRVERSF